MRLFALPGAMLLAVLPSAVWGQLPAGAEFQVNSHTPANQGYGAVASDAKGNFVVVWESQFQDGSGFGVFGQRFDAAGARRGTEFQVNSYTTSDQRLPSVASDADGNFVVVWWGSFGQDGSGYGVFGQRFYASGLPRGSEFQLNAYTTSDQSSSKVASDANGNFVVAWVSYAQDGSASGIFGQRFDSAGAPQGTEFRVNSYTTDVQYAPALVLGDNGDFVVVWQSRGQDGSYDGIFGQSFDSSGVPQGAEFRVNSYTTSFQGAPAVASDANGNFVVAWSSYTQDGSDFGVFGQLFNAAGVPKGSEFQVNTYTTNYQGRPSIGSDANGDFVVVWSSAYQDGSVIGVFGQRFNASGAPLGSEFQVNTYTTNIQGQPSVGSDANGDFVVVWRSSGQDGSGSGVFGQRFSDVIFKDGFESGDLNPWSSSFTDDGDLRVSGAAAMAVTSFGLQAAVNDLNGIFVQDDNPSGEGRYRARFYFDANGFDPGEADSHFRTRIFIAFDASNQRLITLVLKRQSGNYGIEGRVRLNDGTRADTGFFPITDGPHFFEFDWRASSAPAADNGMFKLWIDDTMMADLTGLDNDLSLVEFVRLGAFGIKTGATGLLFYDEFESRRQTFIGP